MMFRHAPAGRGRLYQARISQVMSGLKKAGVDADNMRLTDGVSGGDGMSSERVVTILKKETKSTGASKASDTPMPVIVQ
jgi:hypothetical protein